MHRTTALPLVALLLLTLSPSLQADSQAPNFILVMCDDLGWGDVGFNGSRKIKTPHLDEMAKSSLKFNRFYAASAVCSPTRGSVVTGRHPFRYGIPTANAGHMKAEELTVAEWLKSCGYRTGHFGKWHLGTLTKTVRDSNRGGPKNVKNFSPPWKNGFDVCFSTEAKTPTYDPMRKPKGKAPTRGWDYIQDLSESEPYGTHYWNEKGELVKDNLAGDDARVIMDRAAPFIRSSAEADAPFFAIIWFHTPHLPVVAGPKHAAMYKNHDSYAMNYYGCVTAMDEQMGRLRKTLRDAGVAENTLVAFCSDNGPEGNASAPGSAGPFRGRKRDLYEGGVRVPGLIEWPARIKKGAVTDYPAVTSDYLPTIVKIAAAHQTKSQPLPSQRPIDGLDLSPLFDNPSLSLRERPIGFQFGGKWAWNDNQYKLVFYPGGGVRKRKKREATATTKAGKEGSLMLYDLIHDAGEKNNLAAEMPERVQAMTKAFRKWQSSCVRSANGEDYQTSD